MRKFGRPFQPKHRGITACFHCGCALIDTMTGKFKHYSDCPDKTPPPPERK